MSETTELAVKQDTDLVLSGAEMAMAKLSDGQVEQLIAAIDRANEIRQRMIMVALRRAEPYDFVDFGGKPYLQGTGADRVAPVIGVRFGEPQIKQEIVGEDIFVDVTLPIAWDRIGAEGVAIGHCDTRDKFFAGKDGESATMAQVLERCGGRRDVAVRVMAGNVTKKAVENAKSRGISSLLGIRGLTWDRLSELGFTRDKAGARVDFAKGKTQAKTQAQQKAVASGEQTLQFLPLDQVAKLTGNDNHVSTSAYIKAIEEAKTKAGKDFVKVTLIAGDTELTASYWHKNAPEWAVVDATADIRHMSTKDFNGRTYFNIESWQLFDEAAGNG